MAAYLATLCPTVYVEGSGELIGATYLLGTPHPTGYPLYCLVVRVFTALMPLASVAYEVNLATALTGAVTAAALCAFLQWRGCGRFPALGAAVAFACSETFWSQSVIAEVYGMSTLFAILVIALGLRAADGDVRLYLILAFAMGMGVTTHLSQVLLWPGLFGLLAWRRPGFLRRPMHHGAALLCFAVGASPIIYLLVRNEMGPGFHWGPIDGPRDLWAHITGELYRSSFGTLPWSGALLNAQRWVGQMFGEFHPLVIMPVVWGAWTAWRRDRNCLLVVAAMVACNLAAAWNYHRDPNGINVFFLLSVLGAGVLLGFGLNDIGDRLARIGWRGIARRAPAVLVAAVVVVGNFHASDRSDNWIVYEYGREILQELPEGAVLVTEGDDAMFALDYLKRIEGLRPDVLLFSRVGRGTDMLTPVEKRYDPLQRQQLRRQKEASWIRSGRPVHYLVPTRMPDPRRYEFKPVGLTFVVAPKSEPSHRQQKEVAAGLSSNALRTDLYRDAWVRKIQSNYWFMLGSMQQYYGESDAALESFEQAASIAHDSRTARFNTGLIYFRNNKLQDAERHLRASLSIDPHQPRVRRLLAEVLRRSGDAEGADIMLKSAGNTPGDS